MSQIVLTPEQFKIVSQSKESVAIVDDEGRLWTKFKPLSNADLEALEHYKRDRTLNVPLYPAEQVEAQMRRLDEIREREGMDAAKMHDLLRRMRAGEEV
jgi:hypothetical protein